MSQQERSHIIPPDNHHVENGEGVAHHNEDAERRAAAAEAYRQYRTLAHAPIIWPRHLEQQQQQQLAFLWSQLERQYQEHYLQERYRLNHPYVPPQPPAGAIRVLEPIRFVNRFRQMIHVVEDTQDDAPIDDATTEMIVEGDNDEETDASVLMRRRDGSSSHLIR